LLVRNALFQRVSLAARGKFDDLGALDAEWGWRAPRWRQAIDAFFEEHDELLVDGDARSTAYFSIDETHERDDHSWEVRQIFHDADGDNDFQLWGTVDLDATQETGSVVFSRMNVGFYEDLAG
jgi:hypothetical protein